MQVSWMSSGFYRTCEWIWRLAYVNLLWLLFSLLGLVIFGVAPATFAMFTVMRKWFLGEPDIPIYRTFIDSIKKDFLKANIIVLIFAALGYILYFNYQYLGTIEGSMLTIQTIGWYITMVLFLITLLFIIPVYVHFDMKLLQSIKTAFIIGIINPLALITLVISFVLAFYLFYYLPGLIPFFGVSLLGWIVMWCAHMSFGRIERKQEKLKASSAV
ncbi:YesL family protein [Salipaludibacillus sp. HK11]|uniref:YesL family protein n=1 Tax=Salipaludibacillus sp. HK11 TaxID=3394320 RepID=UPI0039FC5119